LFYSASEQLNKYCGVISWKRGFQSAESVVNVTARKQIWHEIWIPCESQWTETIMAQNSLFLLLPMDVSGNEWDFGRMNPSTKGFPRKLLLICKRSQTLKDVRCFQEDPNLFLHLSLPKTLNGLWQILLWEPKSCTKLSGNSKNVIFLLLRWLMFRSMSTQQLSRLKYTDSKKNVKKSFTYSSTSKIDFSWRRASLTLLFHWIRLAYVYHHTTFIELLLK
jgi:hypothetical protein